MPNNFYFEVESIGNLEPDAIIQQGIKVMQQKLAAVLQDLTEGDGQANGGGYDAPQSPDVGMGGQNWQDQGYATPYGGGNAWGGGGGAATPYGATPYGQNGHGW